ncbi:hypothetical protein [Candidatus Protochlamydia amoebophila]|uniref:Uncharacterized protein n=1 Tax=Candidatus Protochlamydia amoebophila TaxID=362787 RepID=A0A0C1HEZ6_9BACT|nr:hypothetical protein [Candidatus Protochlamydia amoebophila]KIC73278.1 Uncharacterized protein DB44_BH00010 [Candidatus Protochlamydia amoebophila]
MRILAQQNEILIKEIEKFRLNKRKSKGGFDSRIYNLFIDIQEDNPAIEYYLAKANQYPQINHSQNSCIFCQIANQERKSRIYSLF